MKRSILFLAMVFAGFLYNGVAQTTSYAVVDFDGTTPSEIVNVDGDTLIYPLANPDQTGNTSANVGQWVRKGLGSQWSQQIIITDTANGNWFNVERMVPSDTVADTKGLSWVTMDVWTDVADVNMEISFTNNTTTWPANFYSTHNFTTTKTGEWETVEFTFTDMPAVNGTDDATVPAGDSVNTIALVFNQGATNDSNQLFYFDNLLIHIADSIPPVIDGIKVEKSEKFNISVSPNPTTDMLTVTYDINRSGYNQIRLTNQLGSEVMEVKKGGFNAIGKYTENLNLSTLPTGLYFVEMIHGNEILIEKVIKK